MLDEQKVMELQGHGQDIPALLAHWAEQRGDHPVLVWEPGEGAGRTWTYADLWNDVRRLAAGLADRGIAVDDKVLIHSENAPEMVIAWLACATVGAVAVTTNTKSSHWRLLSKLPHAYANWAQLTSRAAPAAHGSL